MKSKNLQQVLVASIKGGKENQMLMSFVYFEKSREELLSYGCSCVHCELNWNSVVLFPRRVEIRKTLRKTSLSKKNNQQESQPTCDDDSGIRNHLTAAPISLHGIARKSRLAVLVLKALGHEDIDVLNKFCAKLSNECLNPLGRFSYDLEMKTLGFCTLC